MDKSLDSIDRALLLELVTEHREGVASGDVSGYPGTRDERLAELDELAAKLTD